MASSNPGSNINGPKQGITVGQNALLGGARQIEDEANSEAEVEPGSSSDSMNVSTRVSIPGKLATSAFEIIAVELQPDSSSSPGNGNLHHSSLSLGGTTNDTDQEQDFQLNGGVASEECLANESESEALQVGFHSGTTAADPQLNESSSSLHIHRAAQEVIDFASTSETAISNANVPTTMYTVETPVSVATSTATSLPSNITSVAPIPAPSVSTIKTETGREITILKVEAEFRRGRWQCSDYHDHRDTSPPPPNPSPASGVISQITGTQQQPQSQLQQPQASAVSHLQAQPQTLTLQANTVSSGAAHLPVILEQANAQAQPQQPNILTASATNSAIQSIPLGIPALSQQHRFPQPQQNYSYEKTSSTQQMVEKTAAALSRALSTDAGAYPSSAVGTFGFGHTTALGVNNTAPVLVPSAASTATSASSGFLNAGGHMGSGNSCVADLAAIEVKVAQALDLVKKYLMAAVRHELEAMQGEVVDLQNRLEMLQRENELLRANVPDDVLQSLLLAEQVPSTAPLLQPMAGTPATSVDPSSSMPTPPSPSFVVSSTSPNNGSQSKVSSLNPGIVTVRSQLPTSQQQYYTQVSQRDRSPSDTTDVNSERQGETGFVSDGCDYASSLDVPQT